MLAQAKINLFLRVLAREASGYHAIETLFQRLDLADDVTVRITPGARGIDCRGADVGPAARNLAYRAAAAYADATGWPAGFAIEIDKRIPVGGGLGGGSADAGAVLRCLNALAPRPLASTELLALAGPLGADVPFLTLEAPLALAWGRGERMLVLPPLPARPVTLALFEHGVATAEAYAALAAERATYAPQPAAWTIAQLSTWAGVAGAATNDFEAVVLRTRPDIATARELLEHGARDAERMVAARAVDRDGASSFALMSGSGATVFSVMPAGSASSVKATDADGRAVMRTGATRTATRVAEVQLLG